MAVITLAEYKAIVGTTSTANDTQISTLIPLIQGDIISICNFAFGTDSDPVVETFPTGMKLYASQMINFLLSGLSDSGLLKSENIGSYSYSKNDLGTSGYPISIEKGLSRWTRASCKTPSIMTQYRDRREYTAEQLVNNNAGYDMPGLKVEES